jgi:acyl carrier protein
VNQNKKILALITPIANEFNEQLEFKIDLERGGDAPLFGHDGVLDSLGLVSFVVAVEQAIESELGVTLTVADEKAMSQKHSPFRTIGALANYVEDLMKKVEET